MFSAPLAFSILSRFSAVGFGGARSGAGAAAGGLAGVAAAAGVPVFASCGRGAPAAALAAAGPLGRRFAVADVSRSVPFRARFVLRAVAMLRELAAAGPAPCFFCWPGVPAPSSLVSPSVVWQSCGSGSWSEVALACGLWLPVAVFVPSPSWLPGAGFGGSWCPGPLPGSWSWSWREPAAAVAAPLPLVP